MIIAEMYSHLNGYEYILVHKPYIWDDIQKVIAAVDATACMTKISNEKTMKGKILYSPKEMNRRFKNELLSRDWKEARASYWVTSDYRLIRKTMHMSPDEQKEAIRASGMEPILSYNQTDFVKDRIAIEIQFGKYPFVAYDLFVKHMAFFVGDKIDVGIEVLPMKKIQAEMSSGVPYYEGELYNLLRQGRGVPAVPLVLIGLGAEEL